MNDKEITRRKEQDVAIKVHIHMTHRQYTDGMDVVEIDGKTVGECLKNMIARFPGLKEAIFEKNGELKRTTEIFVNNASAYPKELAKKVQDGDSIHILHMIAGG